MKRFVITITRQFGSLGRPIGKKMAELLNVDYYDRDIVEAAAEHLQLPLSFVCEREESAKSTKFFNMKYPLGTGTSAMQDKIFEVERNIIKNIADTKSCIIVGRCADAILQNYPNALHIYIYAPYEQRFKNCTDTLGMSPEAAAKMIADVDKARISYHQHYAKFKPADVNYKNILIDSSLLGPDKTAELLCDIVRDKFY